MTTIDPNCEPPRPNFYVEIEGKTYGRTYVREAEPGDVTPWGETIRNVHVRKTGTSLVFDTHVAHYGHPLSTILLLETEDCHA